nr:aldo keto reductase family 1 member B4 [Hymenolepis microstoma]
MSDVPSLVLNSGYQIPQIGFRTFDAPKEDVIKSVECAIDTGFRHIDCAMFYDNEAEVGQAIAAGMKKNNLKREDLFVTSKLWCDKHAPEDVRKSCELSIRNLGVEYLDLYLIHWPVSFQHKKGVPFDIMDPNTLVYENHKIEDTWKAMEQLVSTGLVKSIGVSNFNKRQIEKIIAHANIFPAVNQVEVNLHWLNEKLIDFCHSKNIQVEAYAPLGSPGFMKGQVLPLVKQPNVIEIAQKYNKTPGQVLLRHALQRGIVVLTKSVRPKRIESKFKVFDFTLTKDEMEKLNKAGQNQRIFHVPAFAKHPEYPFHDEY